MRPQPEEVLKLAAKIVALKQDLAAAQAQWDRLIPNSTSTQQVAVAVATKPSPRIRKGSGIGRILTTLSESPENDFDPVSLSESLDIPLGTTRTILSKLVGKKKIEKRGYGKYGALRAKEEEVNSEEKTS